MMWTDYSASYQEDKTLHRILIASFHHSAKLNWFFRGSAIPYRQHLLLFFLLLFCAVESPAQTTLSSLVANNTSACPSGGKLPAHCQKPFPGQIDTRPQVATPQFDSPAGNVSDEDLHGYLTLGANTKIFANIMPGFCTSTDSDRCHNNVQTGYSSNDKKTVAAQAEDMRRRHIDGAIMTWEGAGNFEDATALTLQAYLNANHCRGPQQCDPMYLIMYDGPSVGYTVLSTGIPGTTGASCNGRSGAEYENCVVAHIRNDMCYMNGKHWGNDAYQKSNGRPMVMIFPDYAIIPAAGAAPSWADVWIHVDEWNHALPRNCAKPPYNADNGVPLIVFENAGGFTHAATSGAYYWVKPEGTDPVHDQSILNIGPASTPGTLDNFYQAALERPNQLVFGAAFKGFNSSKAAWGPDRIMDQQCGQVWLASLNEANRYYSASALPYLQIATWNDYNEGTEIETGIDNCYTVTAKIEDENLVWNLDTANPASASLSTVSHLEIYDSRNGKDLTLLTSVQPASNGTYPLKDLSPGKHQLFVRMVGKNSILNRISPPVAFSKKHK
jgi:hypothetical protein